MTDTGSIGGRRTVADQFDHAAQPLDLLGGVAAMPAAGAQGRSDSVPSLPHPQRDRGDTQLTRDPADRPDIARGLRAIGAGRTGHAPRSHESGGRVHPEGHLPAKNYGKERARGFARVSAVTSMEADAPSSAEISKAFAE